MDSSSPVLFQVVALLNDCGGLPRGQVGTVVEELGGDSYLVEFSDDAGKTFAIKAVPGSDLKVLHDEP